MLVLNKQNSKPVWLKVNSNTVLYLKASLGNAVDAHTVARKQYYVLDSYKPKKMILERPAITSKQLGNSQRHLVTWCSIKDKG
jgi:hypothetical protein